MPIFTRPTPGRRRLERLLDASDVRAGEHYRVAHFVNAAMDRPPAVPQAEARARAHRVLLRGRQRRQRTDVAPVTAVLEVLNTRHAVLAEVVRIDALALANARQHIAPEIHLAALARLA